MGRGPLMSLEHILLGVLGKPQSGYDLKQWFDDVFAFFWNADQSQIYRTMARLEGEGHVTSRHAPSAIGPAKRVYRATAKGKAELRRWLKEGPVSPSQRSAIYAQLIFLAQLPDREARIFLQRFAEQAVRAVAALEKIMAEDDLKPVPQDAALKREAFFNRASLGLGIARAKAASAFAQELLAAHQTAFPEQEDEDHGHAA